MDKIKVAIDLLSSALTEEDDNRIPAVHLQGVVALTPILPVQVQLVHVVPPLLPRLAPQVFPRLVPVVQPQAHLLVI